MDRIEFDAGLRRVDVARDLAFLAMDLEAREQRWAAQELIEVYRRLGLDPGNESLRAFYAAHCAIVRAKVALIAAGGRARRDGEAQQLWSLKERLCWRARAPLALVICGPAASGKSVLAAELARRSRWPVLSSDEVRKRLACLRPDERAEPEHYSAGFTRATYEELGCEALQALENERNGNDDGPVGAIIDATCRSRATRAPLLDKLNTVGARLLAVRCEIPLPLALERAERRLQDPARVSDATPEIVAEQYGAFEELTELPIESVVTLDTTQSLDKQVSAVARTVDRYGSCGAH